MAIEPLAVLTPPPDWQGGITETLAWMTSVTESPMAVEQRMGLRLSPRQMFEVNYTLFGARRTYFDLLVMAGAGSPLYLPIWTEPNRTLAALAPGGAIIAVDTTYSELQDCRLAVLITDDLSFTSEVVEVIGRSAGTLSLADGVTRSWPKGARIYPCKKVRVETQPSGNRLADRAYQARARFLSLEPNNSTAAAPPALGEFLGNYVLEEDPNEVEALSHSYERQMFTLDQQTGLQQISDVGGFVHQAHAWFARGRAALWRLRGLFYALQGRRVPIWIPSHFMDFDLALPIGAADTALTVRRCGYTDTGGPFKHREYILIQLKDGTRLYRQIVAAALTGANDENELLGLSSPIGSDIPIAAVQRISFLVFCRLDQDTVELVHHTDTRGLTTCNAVFRTDPGIGETAVEIDPDNPPDVPPVFDPFRVPDQKLFMYGPFGSTGIAEPPEPLPTPLPAGTWAFVSWGQIAPDDLPHDLIEIETGNHVFTLPSTGSFQVRARTYFGSSYGIPYSLGFRLRFINSTLPPVEINGDAAHTIGAGSPLEFSQGRIRVADVIADPDLPFQIEAQFIAGGWTYDEPLILGMNVFAWANPTNDVGPPDDEAHQGDAFIDIEWWS